MAQDFTKRMAIVVRQDLQSWQLLNTVTHIAAYLGNKMKEPFDTGKNFFTRDGVAHPRNSQFPIVIFAAKLAELKNFMAKVRSSGLLYIGFVPEMIETTSDEELEKLFGDKSDAEVEYNGIGLFGDNDRVKPLVKKFSLWK